MLRLLIEITLQQISEHFDYLEEMKTMVNVGHSGSPLVDTLSLMSLKN